MELNEIYQKLCSLNIPVAYLHFTNPQKLPFCVYFEGGSEIQGADGFNLFRNVEIVIELYTVSKNIRLERQIENLFRDCEISKTADTWLDSEEMHMVGWSFETIQKMEV